MSRYNAFAAKTKKYKMWISREDEKTHNAKDFWYWHWVMFLERKIPEALLILRFGFVLFDKINTNYFIDFSTTEEMPFQTFFSSISDKKKIFVKKIR